MEPVWIVEVWVGPKFYDNYVFSTERKAEDYAEKCRQAGVQTKIKAHKIDYYAA